MTAKEKKLIPVLVGLLAVVVGVYFYMNRQDTVASIGEVKGKVVDARDGSPMPAVSIRSKGGARSVTTAADGSFSIRMGKGQQDLIISSVGYSDQEVVATGGELVIRMKVSEVSMSDVVVTGYGSAKRRDIVGSVAKVSAKDITNTPATSFESALQGRASGVLVQQQNGKVGQGINIRIRGASSVTAGNEPLVVVDGVPVTTDNISSNGAATNALADINMNDIESIEILKDASSAAIYGSRASNGVVLITTKKGRSGQSKIEFGMFTGVQSPTGMRKFLNAEQWVKYQERAALGAANQDFKAGYYPDLASAQDDYLNYVHRVFTRYSGGNEDWKTYKVNTDWQEQAFQRAPMSQYDLNLSGGNDRTRYYVSGQYLDQKGMLVGNGYKRYSARLNLEQQVTKWLTAGMNMSFARSRNDRVSNDNAFSTPLQIVALSPITPLIDPRTGEISGARDTSTGRPNTNYPVYYNPLLNTVNAFYKTMVNRTFGNAFLSATITKGLVFRSEFGMDQLNQTEEGYSGKLTARNSGVPNGSGFYNSTSVLNLNTNNYFNYRNVFAERHSVDLVGGMSFQTRDFEFGGANGEQFPSDAYRKLSSAASKTNSTSSSTSNSLLSYFARANYKFRDRYLLALSGRVDGSSRFGANNRYGFFPAAAAGWVLSEESFMRRLKWVNFLKLKAGYGVTGNDNIADFASRGLYSGNGAYGGQAGQVPTQIANPDLKWESTAGVDVGFEAGLFNSRLSVEFSYYQRDTRDLLLNVDVPGTTGFSSQYRNVGKMNNKGFEVTLNSTNISGKNFRWTTSLNMAINHNKVVSLGGQVLGDGVNKAREGQPLGVFVAREFAGADPQNGDALYYLNTAKPGGGVDRTTTNNYNSATDVVIGKPIPDLIYGFDNAVVWKGFDLDVFFQGVHGNQIYNGGGQYMSASGSNGFDNQTLDQLKAWDKPGDKTMVPEARLFYANGTNPSSRFISDGSYLRLKAVTLGYNLPRNLLKKIHIDRFRVYVKGQNLYTFTKYDGWDPEVNADYQASNINQGQDFYSAPQARTIVFGLNIGL